MADKVYKIIEIVGTSDDSVDQAMRNAVERASKSLKGLDWVEMTNVRGLIENGKLSQFQVSLKVGFRMMEEADLKG